MSLLPAPVSTVRAWRDSWPARVVWALISWTLFTGCFSLLLRSSVAVLSLGGSCASGGPYEIEVECPPAVAAFTPLSIFGGLAAVGVSLLIVRGFGTPLVAWSWTVLFVGLSIPFFAAGVDSVTGVVVGVVFAVMGGLPLLGFLASGRLGYLIVGSCDVQGRPFSTAAAASPEADGVGSPRRAGVGDGLLAVAITLAGVAAGLTLAQIIWSAAI